MTKVLPTVPEISKMWEQRNAIVRVRRCFLMPEQAFSEFDAATCMTLKSGTRNVLILGDSFAADFYGAAHRAYPGINFLQATAGNCTPVIIADRKPGNCTDLLDSVFNNFLMHNKPDAVVLTGNWMDNDLAPLRKTLQILAAEGQTIVLVGPPLRFTDGVPSLIFKSGSDRLFDVTRFVYQHRNPEDAVSNELAELAKEKGIEYLRVQDVMCDGQCTLFDASDQLLFIDFGHLSTAGSVYYSERLHQIRPELFGK